MDALREWIEARPGRTQRQLAEKLGISEQFMSAILTGREALPAARAILAHQVLRIPLARLVASPDSRRPVDRGDP